MISNNGKQIDIWSLIWSSKVPPRIKMFMWKFAHSILLTRAMISYRYKEGEDQCMRCINVVEDQSHLFWRCDYSKRIWREVERWWDVSLDMLSIDHLNPCDFLYKLSKAAPDNRYNKAWIISIATVLWSLWKSRNVSVFEHQNLDTGIVISMIKSNAYEWSLEANIIAPNSINLLVMILVQL